MDRSDKTVFGYVFKLNELAAAVAFTALCLVVSIQVFTRYVFKYSFGWAEELPIFLFLWVSFLAAAAAGREGSHLSVTLVAERLPDKFNRVATYLNLVLSLIFFVILLYNEFMVSLFLAPSTFVVLKISKAYCYVGIPASCALFAVYIIEQIILQAKKDLAAKK